MSDTKRPNEVISSVQALRALAVSFVIAAHVYPDALKGGFIGVDVFFVISGFLITGHLLRDMEAGAFSFLAFYARRARRLLPASVLVLAVCLGLAWALLPFSRAVSSLADIRAASLYYVNWHFAANATDYFAASATASPVNHYWSLSVEEQFYMAWPLVLFLSLRGLGWLAGARATVAAAVALTLVGVASFVWASHLGATRSATHYFDTFARAWEFAAGGLAYLVSRNPADRGTVARVATLAGWGALVWSAATLTARSRVPGLDAVPAIAGTAAILALGDRHSFSWVLGTLRLRPVQWTGDLSYSLYLWHWPLIVFAPFVLGSYHLTDGVKIALLLLCAALAAGTKLLVEDRFRTGRPFASRPPAATVGAYLALSFGAALAAFGAGAVLSGQARTAGDELYARSLDAEDGCFGARAAQPGVSCPATHIIEKRAYLLQSQKTQKLAVKGGGFCQNERGNASTRGCSFGADEATAAGTVALLGDSHTGMWAAMLATLAGDRNLRVRMLTASSCPVTLDPDAYSTYLQPQFRKACRDWREAVVRELAADPDVAVVFVSGHVEGQKRIGPDGTWEVATPQGFADAWVALAAAGKQVVVINDVPFLPVSLPDCLAIKGSGPDACAFPRKPPERTDLFARAARLADNSRVHFIDLDDVFCQGDTCHPIVGGVPAYLDQGHISAPFARSAVWKFDPLMDAFGFLKSVAALDP